MSRSAAPPNAGRAVPVPAVYYALLAEVERERRRFGLPMWKLDEAAGGQDGYFAKSLYPETPSGRMATWITLQRYIEAIFPDGFSVNLTPARGVDQAASHRLTVRFSGARYDLEARRDWMQDLARRVSPEKHREKHKKISPRRRRAIARAAARQKWLIRRGKEIESKLCSSAIEQKVPNASPRT